MFLRVLKYFIDNPYGEVYLRELAKKTKLSPFAVKKYADLLLKQNLILEERKANLRYFKANIGSLYFRHLKISFNIDLLLKSGLVEYLQDNIANVSSIVLFGSMAKGEDDEKSDVDILIIGKEKHLDLRKYEEKIEREITTHTFLWSDWNKKSKEDKAFYLEIIANGICLYGEKPVV